MKQFEKPIYCFNIKIVKSHGTNERSDFDPLWKEMIRRKLASRGLKMVTLMDVAEKCMAAVGNF